ncbi:polysaccharide pyruvyl transferase family protein [Halobacillus campisalis]|uniref:polysaccharide pyruvyl transferase family protein n=1 Tax=Halobacillus campisalis TaxID=435909 RepID=UPI00259BBC9D|nr:polysaccharide pyruvyl transferase family protein [Halobacillus campisalis]
MPIGLYFILTKKKLMVIGVGGGPISNKFLRKMLTFILNKAKTVTVRDNETAEYYKKYGVNNQLTVTSDSAQIITPDVLPVLNKDVEKSILSTFENKKIIFLHINNYGDEFAEYQNTIIKSLNLFLKNHNDYGVIIGADVLTNETTEQLKTIKEKVNCDSIYVYNYQSPWQLCSLLNRVDVILTTKLHVGILGASFSKSVLAFPNHYEKVRRYYNQIGEEDRCLKLTEVTEDKILNLLENYHNERIILPESIVEKAKSNFEIMRTSISDIKQ